VRPLPAPFPAGQLLGDLFVQIYSRSAWSPNVPAVVPFNVFIKRLVKRSDPLTMARVAAEMQLEERLTRYGNTPR